MCLLDGYHRFAKEFRSYKTKNRKRNRINNYFECLNNIIGEKQVINVS